MEKAIFTWTRVPKCLSRRRSGQRPERIWGFRFSPFLTITSGRPYNITTGRDQNGDGLYTDRPWFAADPNGPGVRATPYGFLDPTGGSVLIPRNYADGPGLVAANMRASKAFDLPRKGNRESDPRQIVLSVNARNVLNHPNFAAPDGNLSSLLFGKSSALVNGGGGVTGNRRLDLQVRFNF